MTATDKKSRHGSSQIGTAGARPSAASMPSATAARTSQATANTIMDHRREAGDHNSQRGPEQRILQRRQREPDRGQRLDRPRPAQFVREQRRSRSSGTVVAGNVAASATPRPWPPPGGRARRRRPGDAPGRAGRRCSPAFAGSRPWWRPGNPAGPSARASSAPGRKLWLICDIPSRAAIVSRRPHPGIKRRDQPTPAWSSAATSCAR